MVDPTRDKLQVSMHFGNKGNNEENMSKNIQIEGDELISNVPAIEDSAQKEYREHIDKKLSESFNPKIDTQKPFRAENDYVNYGLDYEGVASDPEKVDVELPLMDYVLQLLYNPK